LAAAYQSNGASVISGKVSFFTFSGTASLSGAFTLTGATGLAFAASLTGADAFAFDATALALAFVSVFAGAAALDLAAGFRVDADLLAADAFALADALEEAELAFTSTIFDFEPAFAAAFLASGANLVFTDGRAVFFLVATSSTPNSKKPLP